MIDLSSETIGTLRAGLSTANTWHEISRPLRRTTTSQNDASYVLACAFDYMLQVDRTGTRDRNAGAFEPMLRFEGGETVPPLLDSVPSEWLDVWERAALPDLPAAGRARLHDLLTEARHGDLPVHAREAIAAYVEVARSEEWHALDRADSLIRAVTLARSFSVRDTSMDIVALMVSAAERSLDASEPEPGVALRLLRSLVQDSSSPADVDRLLMKAREMYPSAHLVQSVVELQRIRARGNPAVLRQLDSDRVNAWLQEAERAEGLVKLVHLETAARLAGQASLRELEELARQRLQAIPAEDIELATISEETTLPQDVVDRYLAPFTTASTVPDLLVALISHPPTTGHAEENRRALEQSRSEFPLQYLFPRVVLGGDRLPRWTASTDEERYDGDLAQQELLRFQLIGGLMARGLWKGGQTLHPRVADVKTFIQGLPNSDEESSALLARAFAAYWRSDWTGALFLALPLAEALSRRLVLALERGIYQTQRGQRPGQYPGLGALLRWLKDEGLDDSWHRYMWTLLASPAGLNLRNEVAHGFVCAVDPEHAAAVLHITLYLAALNAESSESAGESALIEHQ